jgi:hypothetical protein
MMFRGRVFRVAAAAAVLGWFALAPSARAGTAPLSLLVPQATGFTILGHSCGGIRQNDFGSGFDALSGYPDGDVYLWTTCSSGGRGGGSTTYSAWLATTWDFTGALVSYTTLAVAPSVNPTLSVYDAHNNNLYNQSNGAYLVLTPGFVPAPRVSGLSPSSAPQGSSVTIGGTGFTGALSVSFGTTAAMSFTVNSDTSISAIAPAVRTGTVDVTVTGPGGRSATNSSDRFTFVLTPRVAGLQPNRGSADGGRIVTITGVNFTGATAVRFGGLAARFKVTNDTSIIAISPSVADPTVVDVTVTSKYGTSAISSADQFTYS